MTTLAEAKELIYLTFFNGWGATSAYTFDNENFTPPVALPWARLAVRHNLSNQASLGPTLARKYDRSGSIFIQCFAPLDSGTATADNLASIAQGIFEGKTLTPDNVRIYDVTIREIGPDEQWYMINVEAFFEYTQTK